MKSFLELLNKKNLYKLKTPARGYAEEGSTSLLTIIISMIKKVVLKIK